jgi:hypothetical protein
MHRSQHAPRQHRWILLHLVVASLAWNASSPSRAQEDPTSIPNATLPNVLPKATALPGLLGAAEDLRAAAETAERISSRWATALETSTRQLAEMSDQFDPLGLKAAMQIIRAQNETIQRLMEAEIQRLQAENDRLRRSRDARPRGRRESADRRPRNRNRNQETDGTDGTHGTDRTHETYGPDQPNTDPNH